VENNWKTHGFSFRSWKIIPGERENPEPKDPWGPGALGLDEWQAVQLERVPGRPCRAINLIASFCSRLGAIA